VIGEERDRWFGTSVADEEAALALNAEELRQLGGDRPCGRDDLALLDPARQHVDGRPVGVVGDGGGLRDRILVRRDTGSRQWAGHSRDLGTRPYGRGRGPVPGSHQTPLNRRCHVVGSQGEHAMSAPLAAISLDAPSVAHSAHHRRGRRERPRLTVAPDRQARPRLLSVSPPATRAASMRRRGPGSTAALARSAPR
jgi:hypothetical protein